MDEALSDPELAKLLNAWGCNGDTGWIAEDDSGARIGACWYRFWQDTNHSWGYIDEETPELGIGVVKFNRGRGIGCELLRVLLSHAANNCIGQVSLSVEKDNPAYNLYSRVGFVAVEEVGNAWTMVAKSAEEKSV